MRTLVITPTYDEAVNIERFLTRARFALPDADILVVDDGSPDGTADIAERVARRLGQVSVMRRTQKHGLGEAYRAGFAHGLDHGYDVLIEIDADGQHDPGVLPRLVAAIKAGADLAIGSRWVTGGSTPNWPWRRRLLSRCGSAYSSAMLRVPVHDLTAGFRAYRASVLRAIDYASTRATGYGFQIEMTYRVAVCGGRIAEVPIRFTDRQHGSSKMSGRIAAEALGLVTWWAVRDAFKHREEPQPLVPAA